MGGLLYLVGITIVGICDTLNDGVRCQCQREKVQKWPLKNVHKGQFTREGYRRGC